MERATTRYLVVGDRAHPEFAESLASLAEDGLVVAAGDVATAASSWPYAASPDWIVLALAHRGRVTPKDLATLRGRFPAAHLVGLTGSWCEGETRSGSVPPHFPRIHWTCFPAQMRWLREAAVAHSDAGEVAALAAWESMTSQRLLSLPPEALGVAAVHAATWEAYDALADLCAVCGLAATWWRGEPLFHRELKALLWDSPWGDPADITKLHRATLRHPHAVAVLTVGFPRGDVWRSARDAGLRILPKPFQAADLYEALRCRDVGVENSARAA